MKLAATGCIPCNSQKSDFAERGANALFARATLLAGGGALAARGRNGALRRGLRGSRLPLGCVFCLDFCGGVLLMSGVAHGRSGVCFFGALRGLLFLLFFLWLVLDAGKLAQGFFALFVFLSAAREVHGDNFLDNL